MIKRVIDLLHAGDRSDRSIGHIEHEHAGAVDRRRHFVAPGRTKSDAFIVPQLMAALVQASEITIDFVLIAMRIANEHRGLIAAVC